MNLFDTHFHLLPEDDLSDIVERAQNNNVNGMLVAGSTISETPSMLDRITPFNNVYAAVGVHPHEAAEFNGDILEFREFSHHPKVKAIGEIGLDYYYDNSPRDVQRKVFESFLELAVETELPAVIHCRDAFEDCYQFIKNHSTRNLSFVIHCFTGSKCWAKRFLDLGGYLSFNGILTFKKSKDVRSVLRDMPINKLLFETDAPYLAPDPFRGKKNEPANLVYIVERAAKELGTEFNGLAEAARENALSFFGIPGSQ